jgi:hypothetical protein
VNLYLHSPIRLRMWCLVKHGDFTFYLTSEVISMVIMRISEVKVALVSPKIVLFLFILLTGSLSTA